MMHAKPSMRLAVPMAAAAAVVLAALICLSYNASPHLSMSGSFLASDAGQSHGGFEYVAVWNATLSISGDSGQLSLSLSSGLGDALTRHVYTISHFSANQSHVTMDISGVPTMLIWAPSDTVWNHEFDNYYIASWGSSSPPDEIRGVISPDTFPGLVGHYYVELRLR